MSREAEKLSESIAFRVTRSFSDSLAEITGRERRRLSEVVLALLERGYAAYRRDGSLFEPDDDAAPTPLGSGHAHGPAMDPFSGAGSSPDLSRPRSRSSPIGNPPYASPANRPEDSEPPPVQDHSANQAALFSEGDIINGKKSAGKGSLLKKDEQDARAAARERLAQKKRSNP